jgi:hypothetical protein
VLTEGRERVDRVDLKALQSNEQEYGRNLSANASAAMLESAHTSKENIQQSK